MERQIINKEIDLNKLQTEVIAFFHLQNKPDSLTSQEFPQLNAYLLQGFTQVIEDFVFEGSKYRICIKQLTGELSLPHTSIYMEVNSANTFNQKFLVLSRYDKGDHAYFDMEGKLIAFRNGDTN